MALLATSACSDVSSLVNFGKETTEHRSSGSSADREGRQDISNQSPRQNTSGENSIDPARFVEIQLETDTREFNLNRPIAVSAVGITEDGVKEYLEKVQWISSDPKVIEVKENYMLSRAVGSATVTAKLGKHQTQVNLTVTAGLTSEQKIICRNWQARIADISEAIGGCSLPPDQIPVCTAQRSELSAAEELNTSCLKAGEDCEGRAEALTLAHLHLLQCESQAGQDASCVDLFRILGQSCNQYRVSFCSGEEVPSCRT